MGARTAMLRLLLPAALCLAAASPVQARTFHVLPTAEDGWTIIDPSGIEQLPGGVVKRTWTVGVQRSIVAGEPAQPGYVRTLTEYDCANRETRWRSFSAFSRNGTLVLSRDNTSPTWTRGDASAAVAAELRVVCDGRAVGSAISADSVAKVVIALMGYWDPTTPAAAARIAETIDRAEANTPPAKPEPAKTPARGASGKATAAKPAPAKAMPAKSTPAKVEPARPVAATAPKPAPKSTTPPAVKPKAP